MPATTAQDWKTLDDAFESRLPEIARILNRRRYTPEPTSKGVCGFPIPSGVFASLLYRCACGSSRLKVVGVVAGGSFKHEPVFCLKCGGTDLVFEELMFGACDGQ